MFKADVKTIKAKRRKNRKDEKAEKNDDDLVWLLQRVGQSIKSLLLFAMFWKKTRKV